MVYFLWLAIYHTFKKKAHNHIIVHINLTLSKDAVSMGNDMRVCIKKYIYSNVSDHMVKK